MAYLGIKMQRMAAWEQAPPKGLFDINMMTTIPISGAATMSSLEIAELTGTRHDHVMRDIRMMLEALGGLPRFGGSYLNAQNKEQPCFHLPYDETITLVAGYDAVLRFKIVKRWRELEQAKLALPNFSNPAEAARAWGTPAGGVAHQRPGMSSSYLGTSNLKKAVLGHSAQPKMASR